MNDRRIWWCFIVPCMLVALAVVMSLAAVFQYSVREFIPGSLNTGGFTLDNYYSIGRPLYFLVILDTLIISFLTALFCLLLSYPVAYALVRTNIEWLRTLLVILAITPLFTGEIVRTYAWMLVLGTEGFVNSSLLALGIVNAPLQFMYTKFGVIVALVHYSMPVMIILLATAISHVNRDFEKAAANLGAAPLVVFARVTVPLTMPGIVASTVVIAAWTMSAFATPQLIGGGKVLMISNLVYLQGLSSFNFPIAAVLSAVAFVAAFGSLALIQPFVTRLERRVAQS
ncbi:ABC transporter permease [Aquamicrobium segne]|uniref:ABC transporter permease n=1 Tax=Aquamicrobium segne TaxID=469547 RepID=A0ABW0H2V5_9HYPH